MTTEDPIVDSPTGWVAKHIRQYVETDGRQGHHRWGVTTLLLTTRGRRSGTLRRSALIYGADDGRYVLVASNGGTAGHPSWYLNLRATPTVHVQVAAAKFTATASTAVGAERERLWRLMADMWPDYDRYQKKASREIPVVILRPEP
ncbi:nitroreductase family deazaflavin-dependent oxidoreductase [Actinomycetes bacterium KLBMP 9797]